ncbi:MAG TPA: nitroreductase [Allosphingosinicella sp.]|jgi:nitroreductase
MFNDRSSLAAYLATRRSARPRDLVAPGPDAATLRAILAAAIRTPDHGKLHPWRLIHVPQERRQAFAEMLEAAYRAGKPDAGRLEIEAAHRFAHQAPELVILLMSPAESQKIPLWEQELSCGAVGMNLLHAAAAHGFAGGWVTGWATYSPQVLQALGARRHERIAGFFFLGTPGAELEERPRPDYEEIVSTW